MIASLVNCLYFGYSLPSSTKKKRKNDIRVQSWTPSEKKLSGSAHVSMSTDINDSSDNAMNTMTSRQMLVFILKT